jgi:hypothetical protein
LGYIMTIVNRYEHHQIDWTHAKKLVIATRLATRSIAIKKLFYARDRDVRII